jgi:mRNA-degrading endonuclease RelE of RelBE toxin-antitoxin system
MASYRIVIRESAQAELIAVPFPFRRQLNQRITSLSKTPRRPDSERIGEGELFRLRAHGWVVIYEVADDAGLVTVERIRPDLP